jgi:hypothetical protein
VTNHRRIQGPAGSGSPIKRHKTPGDIKTSKFQALEAEFSSLVKNKRQLLSLWRALDFNGNNIVRYEICMEVHGVCGKVQCLLSTMLTLATIVVNKIDIGNYCCQQDCHWQLLLLQD